MSSEDPPLVIHRPIPRRPFVANPATPPEDSPGKDAPRSGKSQSRKPVERAQFLDPRPSTDTDANSTPGGSESISRTQSILNLTSSTLFGIFSPASASRTSIAGGPSGIFEPSTPWGTGAETPARHLLVEQPEEDEDDQDNTTATAEEIDEVRKASKSLMMLQRRRRQGESFGGDGASAVKLQPAPAGRTAVDGSAESAPATAASATPESRVLMALSVVARAGLLFTLGMGYGVLVSQLRSETDIVFEDLGEPAPSQAEASPTPEYIASYDWRYLVSWGLSGIALGTLLPWFDGVWDRTFGRSGSVLAKARTAPETDWALVVRGIGAFAGVAFAMRKLPWTSTMQASLTLALANPFLWYLLDRSKSGLLLAAAFGFVGSGALMVLNLDLMPNPGMHPGPYHAGYPGMGSSFGGNGAFPQNDSSRGAAYGSLDASAPAVTAETAIWMLSVLFCSCVCFGNIGRRLALRPSAVEQAR
ncbi:hypothetical protein SCUCBS95973_004366 [Sporothrix curviconia]|uniref:Insig domain containing protein n=1 Tax=Sporothrix curviconia TaxID=1260050 RepID=A0ABP0BNM5_9PEZI